MKVFLLDLWNDPAKFRAAARAAVIFIAGLIQSGVLVIPVGSKYAWFASLLGPLALAIPAGQTNPPVVAPPIAATPPKVVLPKV